MDKMHSIVYMSGEYNSNTNTYQDNKNNNYYYYY